MDKTILNIVITNFFTHLSFSWRFNFQAYIYWGVGTVILSTGNQRPLLVSYCSIGAATRWVKMQGVWHSQYIRHSFTFRPSWGVVRLIRPVQLVDAHFGVDVARNRETVSHKTTARSSLGNQAKDIIQMLDKTDLHIMLQVVISKHSLDEIYHQQ
jgi:hypothetical protein